VEGDRVRLQFFEKKGVREALETGVRMIVLIKVKSCSTKACKEEQGRGPLFER